MKRDRQSMDDDLLAADGNETSPSDVLHLNIGGTRTNSIPGSMSASKISERWDDSNEKNKPIGPKAKPTCASLIDLLDDLILREIIAFLPDPETVCTFGGCCIRLQNLVKGETSIWDRFLEQIPFRARPKYDVDAGNPEPTAKEIVLRFSSARLFASRMEHLAPLHRVMLGQGNYCTGCKAFPNATGYGEGEALACNRRGDAFFVRYSISGSLLWQGFLPSYICGNGYICLGDYNFYDFDLSEEFDWPEMKAFLAYPPPQNHDGYPDREAPKWLEEKKRMACAMYKDLTLTIVVIKNDITDRHLVICTCGPDEDKLGPGTYCGAPHMEIMPILSHGVSPKEPMEAPYWFHPYFRTTKDDIHVGGDYIAVGHGYQNSYSKARTEFLPQTYKGPVFCAFAPRGED